MPSFNSIGAGSLTRQPSSEHVVDRTDPANAVLEVRRLTEGRLRYAIDCVGRETATHAFQALSTEGEVFLVGLSGLPKKVNRNVRLCAVPVKTFHTNAAVGAGLMRLLEDLLASDELVLPPVEVIEGGLEAVNVSEALKRSGWAHLTVPAPAGRAGPTPKRHLSLRPTGGAHAVVSRERSRLL